MTATRWIFAVTLFMGFFWLAGLILESVTRKEPPAVAILSLSLFMTLLVCFLLFKLIPDFLKSRLASTASIFAYYALGALASYVLLIPVFALLSYLLILFFGNVHHHETTILIASLALWLPLWWFVPAGMSLGWLLYRKRTGG